MGEVEKEYFLIKEFCEDEYEEIEMKKWIKKKGVEEVYEIVHALFYDGIDS